MSKTVLVASSQGGTIEAVLLGEFSCSLPSWPAVLNFWLTVIPRTEGPYAGSGVVEVTEPTTRARLLQLKDCQGSVVVWQEGLSQELVENWLVDADTQAFVLLRDVGPEKFKRKLKEMRAILGTDDWEALSLI